MKNELSVKRKLKDNAIADGSIHSFLFRSASIIYFSIHNFTYVLKVKNMIEGYLFYYLLPSTPKLLI